MLPKSAFASEQEWRAALRDWFAGQAMAALAVYSGAPSFEGQSTRARSCYAMADAMLAARATSESSLGRLGQ